MEDSLTLLLAWIAKWTAALGVIGTVSYQLFKVFGKKWLDSQFEIRTIHLKNRHDVLLAELKAAQDQTVRHLQHELDREIHRAKKLADREFEVLPECWRLLVQAFDSAMSTGSEWVPQIHKFEPEEVDRLLERSEMKEWEKKELLLADGKQRNNYYRRWEALRRFKLYIEEQRELARYLLINGVFMPPGVKERFKAIETLIATALYEFQGRATDEGPYQPIEGFDRFAALKKLSEEGTKLRDELETIIHSRIWSSTPSPGNAG